MQYFLAIRSILCKIIPVLLRNSILMKGLIGRDASAKRRNSTDLSSIVDGGQENLSIILRFHQIAKSDKLREAQY